MQTDELSYERQSLPSEVDDQPLFTRQIIWQTTTAVLAFAIFFWWMSSTDAGREWSDYPQPPPVSALSTWHQPPPAPPPHLPRSISPAPTLKPGPVQVIRGKRKATWIASGAGDPTYDGTYVEIPGGFVNRNGRYLYQNPFAYPSWALSPVLGMPGGLMYSTAGSNLPGDPWVSWLRWPDIMG
ncbi:MAG: hypothetical protein ACM3VW_06475 [Bacteroidota bacterium]